MFKNFFFEYYNVKIVRLLFMYFMIIKIDFLKIVILDYYLSFKVGLKFWDRII